MKELPPVDTATLDTIKARRIVVAAGQVAAMQAAARARGWDVEFVAAELAPLNLAPQMAGVVAPLRGQRPGQPRSNGGWGRPR